MLSLNIKIITKYEIEKNNLKFLNYTDINFQIIFNIIKYQHIYSEKLGIRLDRTRIL
jgi:hypothetical protein